MNPKNISTHGLVLAFLILNMAAGGLATTIQKNSIAKEGPMGQLHDLEKVVTFVQACWQGEIKKVREGLEEGIHPDARGFEAGPALFGAALNNHKSVVKLLLAHGANVDPSHNEGMTPLMVCAFRGHRDMIRLLLEHGADPDAQTKGGDNALYAAVQEGGQKCAQILLEAGADPNLFTLSTDSALRLAAQNGDHKMVKLFLDHGARLDGPGNNEALQIASQRGHKKVVDMLLDHGADPNLLALPDGLTPLIMAAEYGHFDIVKKLVEAGAHLDHASADMSTALKMALHGEHDEIYGYLVEHGATPGSLAIGLTRFADVLEAEDEPEIERRILEAENPNLLGLNGETMLVWAAHDGHSRAVELLLARGADPNLTRPDGLTALILSAEYGHADVVRQLLAAGADPWQQAVDHSSALSMAAQEGFTECVQLLLAEAKKGQDADYTASLNKAFFMACQKGHLDIVRLMMEFGVDINSAPPPIRTTPLLTAVANCRPAVVAELVKAGGDLEHQSEMGVTALMLAVIYENREIIRVLVEGGAKLDTVAMTGCTAEDVAVLMEAPENILAMVKTK